MWGGQFASGPDQVMEQINPSIDFDKRLYAQDIQGSLAHVTMLAKQEIITDEEAKQISDGLEQVKQEIESGNFTFKRELEDIHMNIEARLKDLIGDVAGKLHTARSRNDQVATDFRLWVRDAYALLDNELQSLQATLITRGEEEMETILPGFTHLQVAQPVSLGHNLLAYVEMLRRDRSRMKDASSRMNESPLGAVALAGTSFPIDREATAKALGFRAPMNNSLDAVSSRDFAVEFLSNASICAMHLSRLAEELILWSSAQFGFITMSDAFSSGSSIMPQKRNPDAAELVRAKTGRIFGALSNLLTVMKGLSLAYNKDMQEDKEPVFEAAEQLMLCVQAMRGMMEGVAFHREVMKSAATTGYSTATDLADWLVRELGMPFRNAHHVTAQIVKVASEKNVRLDELTLAEMQTIDASITESVFEVLSVEKSVASRTSYGGTAPSEVKKQLAAAKGRYL
jgi:argininosuccinate lyase